MNLFLMEVTDEGTLKLRKEKELFSDDGIGGVWEPSDTVEVLEEFTGYSRLASEFLICVALDHFGLPKGAYLVSKGNDFCCDFLKNEIVQFAVLIGARKIFTIHNHPGTNALYPSDEDCENSKALDNIKQILDVEHANDYIVTREGYCSYNKNGMSKTSEWEGIDYEQQI